MLKKLLSTLVCTLLLTGAAFAQGTITGTVTDGQSGETLPGVNIQIPGLNQGTATDADGNFTLDDVPEGTHVLEATFVGYQAYTQEITVSSAEELSLDIELQPDVVGLDDVVVTAFGIERDQRALGYGVSEVTSDDITNRNENDLARALTGQLPGVDIQSSGGLTGSGTDINIRGFSSISGNNSPLFIVDGVRFDGGNNESGDAATSDWYDGGGQQTNPNRLLDIDPSNIKDVSVLKGLSATVLYGEDGRNGVILIETKSGSFGDERQEPGFNVTLNQSVYATQISSRPDYQDEYGGGFDQNFGWFYSNWGPRFDTDNPNLFGSDFRGFADDGTVLIEHPLIQHSETAEAFPELQDADYRYEAKPDPIDAFFRDGLSSNSSFSINGGVQDLRLNINYSRNQERGFTPNNDMTRDAFSIGANYQVFDGLTAQTTFNMSLTDVESPATAASFGSGSVGGGSVFGDVFYTPRSIDLNIPHTNPQTGGSAYYRSGNDIPHPRWTANNVLTSNNTDRYYGKSELNWAITDGLNLVYKMGYDSYTEARSYRMNPGGVNPSALHSTGLYQTMDINSASWDHQLNAQFDYQLNENFSLNGTVGGQYVVESWQRQGVESQDMIIFDFFEHSNFTSQSSTSFFTGVDLQREEKEQTAGVYGDFNIGFQDFVYLNLAGRNDWFSTLEPEHNSIFYPSATLSYVVTDHLDISSDAFTFLKLFGGVSTSAGSPDPYSTRTTLATNARSFLNNDGDVITTNATSDFLGNRDLKPELHTEYEAGVDVRFLDGRLGLNASAYHRSTTDLITEAPLDPATGYTSTFVNVGEIQNEGLELTLNGSPVTGEFQWDVQSNFYTSRSEVIELGAGLDRIQVGQGFTDLGNFAIEGEPFQIMLGDKITRVTEELKQEDSNFADVEVGTPIIGSTGSYIDADDIGVIGNPNPDWELSLSNTFRYKGASLSFQFDYQQGGDMYSTWIGTLFARGLTTTTTEVDRNNTFILPGVNEQGQTNKVQISPSDVFFSNFGFGPSELQVYDMTHIRLTNVRLGYDLPASVITNTPFSQVTVSLSGDNLWMYAFNVPEASGFDPNVNSIGGNSRGFEYLTGPASRRFGGSVTIRF